MQPTVYNRPQPKRHNINRLKHHCEADDCIFQNAAGRRDYIFLKCSSHQGILLYVEIQYFCGLTPVK